MSDKESRIREQRTCEATKKGLMGSSGKIGLIVKHLGEPIVSHTMGGGVFGGSGGVGFTSTPLPSHEEEDDYTVTSTNGEQFKIITEEGEMDFFGNPYEEPSGFGWNENRPKRVSMNIRPIGYYFDGLSRGLHLEIKYMEEERTLSVRHGGYLVYEELGGELQAYVPGDDWEKIIDRLHAVVRPMETTLRNEDKQERLKQAEKNKSDWMKQMAKLWGF